MISFDNLLWSPCVSQTCWWVGICQEWEYVCEGLLYSGQTWFSTSVALSLLKALWKQRGGALLLLCVTLAAPWVSSLGRCRASVFEPVFDTSHSFSRELLDVLLCPPFRNYSLTYFCRLSHSAKSTEVIFVQKADLFVSHSRSLNSILLNCNIWKKNKIPICTLNILPTLFSRPRVILGLFAKQCWTPQHLHPHWASVTQTAGRSQGEHMDDALIAPASLFKSHIWETAERPTFNFTKFIWLIPSLL